MSSIMFSKKGARLRIVYSFKFWLHKYLSDDVERWVCTKKKCRAFMKIEADGRVNEDCNLDHNHEADEPAQLTRQKVANACKRRAAEDEFERPGKIMRKVVTKEALETLTVADRNKIRKPIYTSRGKMRPPLPKPLEELHESIISIPINTKMDEPFLLANDDEDNVVTFSTKKNCDFLVTCDELLMDGTFYCTPKLFQQVFIVHGRKKRTYVPLVYFLLTGKMGICYEIVLRKLTAFLPSAYAPPSVFVDFEESIHIAIRRVWPSTRIFGCRFHLGQSWIRKIRELGLTKTYRSTTADGSYLRSFFGLSFVDPDKMEEFFRNDFTQNEPTSNKQIQKFTNYVYNTYIRDDARFPPSMWSKYSYTLCHTTNACEGLHSRMNNMFYQAHPDIFKFINALLEIQDEAYSKMLSTEITHQRKESREKQEFIKEVTDDFENGTIDMMLYVKNISRKFLPK